MDWTCARTTKTFEDYTIARSERRDACSIRSRLPGIPDKVLLPTEEQLSPSLEYWIWMQLNRCCTSSWLDFIFQMLLLTKGAFAGTFTKRIIYCIVFQLVWFGFKHLVSFWSNSHTAGGRRVSMTTDREKDAWCSVRPSSDADAIEWQDNPDLETVHFL